MYGDCRVSIFKYTNELTDGLRDIDVINNIDYEDIFIDVERSEWLNIHKGLIDFIDNIEKDIKNYSLVELYTSRIEDIEKDISRLYKEIILAWINNYCFCNYDPTVCLHKSCYGGGGNDIMFLI